MSRFQALAQRLIPQMIVPHVKLCTGKMEIIILLNTNIKKH